MIITGVYIIKIIDIFAKSKMKISPFSTLYTHFF